MKQRSFSTQAIVLKRSSIGETDRVVTLLTEKKGKLVCIAKGVRKLKSSKRAYLEPGNIVQAFLINTKSMPLLTQARLIKDSSAAKTSLSKIRQLSQILEIFDKLFVEEEIEAMLYKQILNLRALVLSSKPSTKIIKEKLGQLIETLGFQNPKDTKYKSILKYVEALTEMSMKSYDYLKVN